MARLHYSDSPTEQDKQLFARFLSADEELVLVTGYGRVYVKSQFILGMLLPGGVFWLFGLGLAYLFGFNLGYGLILGIVLSSIVSYIKTRLMFHSHRYLLTTKRVLIKHGLLAEQLTSASYDKITHIEVEQSFIDRVLYQQGRVIIYTAGADRGQLRLDYIGYPLEIKNILERLINRQRERAGVRVGPVETIEGEIIE